MQPVLGRFKYSCLYELDSLAIVNVRDLGGIKHAFKLLVFPDARLFQCANAVAKQVICHHSDCGWVSNVLVDSLAGMDEFFRECQEAAPKGARGCCSEAIRHYHSQRKVRVELA
jgi:hypothetical protein